jgi:NAD(P)-dependent dehydrogenase (short-subunit alcohol dehydrogenase family)
MAPQTGVIFPQHQDKQPGSETAMRPPPESEAKNYRGSGKLEGKVAIITGGDSGIGRATAAAFAKEGADVVIAYLDEHEDADYTKKLIEDAGRRCLLLSGDVGDPIFCDEVVKTAMNTFKKIDILVNNAGQQYPQESVTDISDVQLEKTFRTNIFSMFYLVRAALPHLKEGARIINTASVTAYKGSPELLDYSSTKGAIVSFTRSLSGQLAKKGILVNAVAPGPIWTPLIPASFSPEEITHFGKNVPLGRPGQPDEVAPAYVYFASGDSTFVSGQVLHVNGGVVINT